MRYLRIFFLHFQQAFALRSRSLVWFLIELFNPLIYLLYWVGAYHEKGQIFVGWSLSYVSTYYFLLIIATAFLIVHIEEDISYWDIQQGGLSKYLLKPFSYIQLKFMEELPWRLIQGLFGVILLVAFHFFFGNFIAIADTAVSIFSAVVIVLAGYFVSFLFKMIVGISALWITDYSGLQELIEAIMIVFAGLLMPLEFFPTVVRQIAYVLPFSYMVYFPVLAFQGKLDVSACMRVIGIELLWIGVLYAVYRVLWQKGIKLFTGLGQ